MKKTITVISPTSVIIPRKTKSPKKVSLNLNTYMHINHFEINTARKEYFHKMTGQLYGRKFGKIEIRLRLVKGSRRKIDRANFLSIVEKFFCDALVHHGCIEDDSDEFIVRTIYETEGVEKNNPHVKIDIKEVG